MKRMLAMAPVLALLLAGCAAQPSRTATLHVAASSGAPVDRTLDVSELRSLTVRLSQVTGLISLGYADGPVYNYRPGYRVNTSVAQENGALVLDLAGQEAVPTAQSSLIVSGERPFTLEVAGLASQATLVLGAGSARGVAVSDISHPFKFALTYPTALTLTLASGADDVTLDLPEEEGVVVVGAVSDQLAAQLTTEGFTKTEAGWVESPSAAAFLTVDCRGWTGLLKLGRRRARPLIGA